jgi:hypothetical protein
MFIVGVFCADRGQPFCDCRNTTIGLASNAKFAVRRIASDTQFIANGRVWCCPSDKKKQKRSIHIGS